MNRDTHMVSLENSRSDDYSKLMDITLDNPIGPQGMNIALTEFNFVRAHTNFQPVKRNIVLKSSNLKPFLNARMKAKLNIHKKKKSNFTFKGIIRCMNLYRNVTHEKFQVIYPGSNHSDSDVLPTNTCLRKGEKTSFYGKISRN